MIFAKPNILLVCQTGADIGLGHLMRSLVSARALRDILGSNIILIVQGTEIESGLCAEFDHTILSSTSHLLDAISVKIKENRIDVLILDLFPRQVPADLSGALDLWRTGGCKLVAVDGLISLRDRLDLIFLPSFCCPSIDIRLPSARIVYGWDCLILNVDHVATESPKGDKVLVLTGGSDTTKLGKLWPSLLDNRLPSRSEVHWVTGPFAGRPDIPFNPRLKWYEHIAPQNLKYLMSQTNFAVTVYGVSFFELLHYGVATVVFSPYGLKDKAELSYIASSGLALVAEDERDAIERLMDLINNEDLAIKLSAQARAKLRVPGTKRFCFEVNALVNC